MLRPDEKQTAIKQKIRGTLGPSLLMYGQPLKLTLRIWYGTYLEGKYDNT